MPKQFKPKTWWTVFIDSQPLTHYVRYHRKDSLNRFLLDNQEFSWGEWQRRGYSVRKITVSPFEGTK